MHGKSTQKGEFDMPNVNPNAKWIQVGPRIGYLGNCVGSLSKMLGNASAVTQTNPRREGSCSGEK